MLEQLAALLSHPLALMLLFALVLVVGTSLLRIWLRHRKSWAIDSWPIHLPEADEAFHEQLTALRLELWRDWNSRRTYQAGELARIVRETGACVAREFHPDAENPEEKVNLGQSLAFLSSVNGRMAALLRHPSLGVLRDLSIGEILRWYRRIRGIPESGIFKTLKSPWLLKPLEILYVTITTITPFAIGGRLSTAIGMEFAIRFFFSGFTAIIAEEAWAVFSGKKMGKISELDMLMALGRSMKATSGAEYRYLLSQIINEPLTDAGFRSKMTELTAGSDDGKSLRKLLKKRAGLPTARLEEFTSLESADELAKYSSIREIRASLGGESG